MFNTILHTICVISNTIFDELEFVVIVLLLMDDIDRNKKRKTKIILIYTKDSAERERMTDELCFQQWYANDNSNNNTDNNTDTFDNVSFNSNDDRNFRTINNEFNYMSLNCFGTMNYGFSHGFGYNNKNKSKDNMRVVNKRMLVQIIKQK